jgi:hypothetical protein
MRPLGSATGEDISKTLTGDVDVTAALSDAALTVTLMKNLSGPKGNYAGAVYFGPSVDRMSAFVNLNISRRRVTRRRLAIRAPLA